MITRFHIKDEINNGDCDGDEYLSVAPWMSFPKELTTRSFP